MRRFVDVAALVGTAVLLGLIVHSRWQHDADQRKVDRVTDEVRRFNQMVSLRATMKDTELNNRGWPTTIESDWFKDGPPVNDLLTPSRAWVEVATPDQADLEHPDMRMAVHDGLAGFWYNPYQGVVRARVPVSINDQAALAMYNTVNGTQVGSIFATGADEPARSAEFSAPAPQPEEPASVAVRRQRVARDSASTRTTSRPGSSGRE